MSPPQTQTPSPRANVASLGEHMRTFSMLLLWISGIGVVFWAGSHPVSQSRSISYLHAANSYPWGGVLFFGVVATVEIMLLGLILRPRNYRNSWGRALAAVVIFCGVSMFWAMGSLQQPSYYVMHVYWLYSVDLSLLTLLIITWTTRTRQNEQEIPAQRRIIRDYM